MNISSDSLQRSDITPTHDLATELGHFYRIPIGLHRAIATNRACQIRPLYTLPRQIRYIEYVLFLESIIVSSVVIFKILNFEDTSRALCFYFNNIH